MSARPLIAEDGWAQSLQDLKCYDHEVDDGLAGFITVTGGKATTCRFMRKTADLTCHKWAYLRRVKTKETPLIDYHLYYKTAGKESN